MARNRQGSGSSVRTGGGESRMEGLVNAIVEDEQARRALVAGLLKRPLDYPDEMRGWLPRFLETNPPRLITGPPIAPQVTNIASGVVRPGALTMVRVGSSPFFFELMMYDATYGAWVSASTRRFFLGGVDDASLTSSGVYVSGAYDSRTAAYSFIHGNTFEWRTYDTAGLKPQLLTCFLGGTSIGQNLIAGLTIQPGNEDAAAGTESAKFAEARWDAPASTIGMSSTDFTDIPSATLADYIALRGYGKASDSAAANDFHWINAELRWVSK
jgi:hypothetical protein